MFGLLSVLRSFGCGTLYNARCASPIPSHQQMMEKNFSTGRKSLLAFFVWLSFIQIECMIQQNASTEVQCRRGDSFIDGVSQEVGFSYSLFPELSHPESDQSFIRFVPESPLPQHSSKNSKNKKTKRVPDIAKTRRCSFTNPEAKERLNAAITAYNQIQKHGGTYLVINL